MNRVPVAHRGPRFFPGLLAGEKRVHGGVVLCLWHTVPSSLPFPRVMDGVFGKLVGLTIVAILSASLAGVCAMLLVIETPREEPPPWLLISGILFGAGLTVLAVWLMIRVNAGWQAAFRRSFEEAESKGTLMAKWTVPETEWRSFVEGEGPFNRWQRRQPSAMIWLKGDGFRINDRVATWGRFGYRLKSVTLVDGEKAGVSGLGGVLAIAIEVETGQKRFRQAHRLPVTHDAVSSVAEAVRELAGRAI